MGWNKITNNGIYRLKKQKRKARRQKKRFFSRQAQKLNEYAKELQNNIPNSELWFYELYEPYRDENDRFNTPLGSKIPDVHNKHYSYVIEIDGSIHELNYMRIKDWKKDQYYKKRHYTVIRIVAYDMNSFNEGMKKLLQLKG